MENGKHLVALLEKRFYPLQGEIVSLDSIGEILEEARRLYIRQLDPALIPIAPVVLRQEMLEPFPEHIVYRLGRVIKIAECAFDGYLNGDLQPSLMKNNQVKIPTDKEIEAEYGRV